MATTFKLVRRLDLGSDVDSLDLYSYGGGGAGVAVTRWVPSGRGTETLGLNVRGTSVDSLAAVKRSIDEKIRETGWYADGSELYSVWLRDQVNGETAGRQAFVYSMSGEETIGWHGPVTARNTVLFYALALERGLWEEPNVSSVAVNNVGASGGMGSYGTIYGVEPARIARMAISGATGTTGINEVWVGFRSSRFGNYSNLQPEWMCGDGNAILGDNPTDSEMTFTAGGKAVCDFSQQGEALADRMTIIVNDVTSDHVDQRGEFQVLLRAWVGSGTTCYVQMKDGVDTTTALTERWNAHRRVKVDYATPSGNAFLYNLGTVRFPTTGRGENVSSIMRRQGFLLAAQRTAGSGDLTLDRLILIPRAEGYIYAKNMSLSSATTSEIRQYPEGRVEGWYKVGGNVDTILEIDPQNYGLPNGSGNLVVAAQALSSHTATDALNINLQYYERWRSLRGNDSGVRG